MHSEPDFYLIARQFPLEKSADVPKKDKEKVLKKAEEPFSGWQKTEYLDDFDLGGDSPVYKDDCNLLLTRKPAAPDVDVESVSDHQWDPFGQRDSTHPPRHDAAVNQYDGSTANQSTKSLDQFPSFASSFASTGADRGEAKKEDEDQAGSSVQEAINYDPIPVSNQQLSQHRGRGYSDPIPASNQQLGSHGCHYMHPAHREESRYYGSSNFNRYAAGEGTSHQAAAAAGYYYHQPQYYSQQHNVYNNTNNNMFNYDQWYRNPHYSTYYSSQGLAQAQGYAQPQGANTAQLHCPAQGVRNHNHNSPLPSFFSPMKSGLKEDESESGSKPQT